VKALDDQIFEVENRIARRRMAVELTARAAWRRSVQKVLSPAGLIGAAGVGFLTVAAIFRRRPKIVERRKAGRAPGKWGSVLGLIASGAFTLMKRQYGGPVQMATALASQIKSFRQNKMDFRTRKASPPSAVAH
jgi:hypothetical protein